MSKRSNARTSYSTKSDNNFTDIYHLRETGVKQSLVSLCTNRHQVIQQVNYTTKGHTYMLRKSATKSVKFSIFFFFYWQLLTIGIIYLRVLCLQKQWILSKTEQTSYGKTLSILQTLALIIIYIICIDVWEPELDVILIDRRKNQALPQQFIDQIQSLEVVEIICGCDIWCDRLKTRADGILFTHLDTLRIVCDRPNCQLEPNT